MSFLALAMFLSGSGGAAGLSAAVNAAAKSFSDKTRATASGLVLAGFGLSAFAFSTLGHVLFGGDAGGLLLILSVGTGVPMFIASFIVRAVPPTTNDTQGYEPVGSGDEELNGYHSQHASLELPRSRSPPIHRRTGSHDISKRADGSKPAGYSYKPAELAASLDFWILAVILAILCGTGLMYINNVGSVALALTRQGSLEYDQRVVSSWQAKQVATVSIWNCLGRIIGGIFSDSCKTKFSMKRVSDGSSRTSEDRLTQLADMVLACCNGFVYHFSAIRTQHCLGTASLGSLNAFGFRIWDPVQCHSDASTRMVWNG